LQDKDEIKDEFAQKMGFKQCNTMEDLNLNNQYKSMTINCQNSYEDTFDCNIRLNYEKLNIIKYECEKAKKIE
jgi:hypothetical protein